MNKHVLSDQSYSSLTWIMLLNRFYCLFQTGDTQITPIIANIGDLNVDNLALNYDEV